MFRSAMLRAIVATSFLLAMGFTVPHQASAWNKVGHWAVSKIAYDDLATTPEVRGKLVAILMQHPLYQPMWKHMVSHQADKGAALFMLASSWPDDIKSSAINGQPNPNRLPGMTETVVKQQLNPQHFYDSKHVSPGQHVNGEDAETPNLMTALDVYSHTLRDGPTDADRAIALCWLLHLVGDAHQPLHCISRFSDQQAHGDKGGNWDWVAFDEPNPDLHAGQHPHHFVGNLHAYWDGQLGPEGVLTHASDPFAKAASKALTIEHEKPRDTLTQVSVHDPASWIGESADLAIRDVYNDDTLDFQAVNSWTAHPGSAPELPAGYSDTAYADAKERIALSGYRLADFLRQLTASQ